jgi:exosortase
MLGILVLSFATNIFGRLSIELAAVGLLPIILLFGLALIGGSRRQNARVYVVPLFLYTALPVWDQFSVALQMLTVSVVAFVLQQLGVLALVDGTYVHLRQGVFEIAQGCSGLRFFLTAAAMTIFWTTYQRCLPLRTIAAVLIALSISIVTNWLRVVIIVLTGNSFGMDALVVTSHYFLGWGLFLATLIAAWSIMDRFGLFEPGPDSGRG